MSLNDTQLPSAGPALNDPAQDRPGSCVRCEGEAAKLHGWRMRMLETTAEKGVDLLEEIRQRALAPADDTKPEPDLGLAYSRISRAIRQTVALHAKFEDEANKTGEEKAAE